MYHHINLSTIGVNRYYTHASDTLPITSRTENIVEVVGQSLNRRALLKVRPRPPDGPSQHYAHADEGAKPACCRIAAARNAKALGLRRDDNK